MKAAARTSEGDGRRAAVLGKPVGHSLSPALHRAAYAELGLDGWTYDRYETDEDQLPGFVAGLGPEWAGLSLTMPLKRAALALCATVTPVARSVEAVNTMVRGADGSWHGDNTDVPGLVAALGERGVEKAPEAALRAARPPQHHPGPAGGGGAPHHPPRSPR
ncbi:hypothetical protein ACFV5M_32070, partial [Streptomyces albidoflavus]